MPSSVPPEPPPHPGPPDAAEPGPVFRRADGTVVPDERGPQKPGTAVAAALPAAASAGAAAGVAAAKAITEYGSLGLTGAFKLIGNATAMLLIAVGLIVVYRDMRSDTREQQIAASAESHALVQAIMELKAEAAANRAAVEGLAREVRSLRGRGEK